MNNPIFQNQNQNQLPQLYNIRSKEIKDLQIPDNLQLPVYGFVFMAGLVVGSLLIQSFYKK